MTPKPKLLIVDDDEEIRTQMRWALAQDYDVTLASDRASALEQARLGRPTVVLLDLGLPPNATTPDEGMATLAGVLELNPAAKVVIISGQNEKANALNAIGAGAHDFLGKPIQMEELKLLLKRCFYVAQLEQEYRALQDQVKADSFEGLLGSGKRMQGVFDTIRKVATVDAPVLILGESGTGKEMTARAIHRCSARRDGPFVAINCSAIPETLIESELFGHERGAFTGAHAQRKGRIETAAGGTLFLDEIGEVPLPIQVKLLRFLQESYIERIGGRQPISVDTRVVAATNADLAKGMQTGTFREDLFYRLAVVQITLPPLRERNDDAVVLAKAFLRRFASEMGKSGLSFTADALGAIRAHDWPGNVRELQNRVRRAAIMSEEKALSAADLELAALVPTEPLTPLRQAREKVERELLTDALRRHGGNISSAATELGISRPAFYELMAKLGIESYR